MKIFLTMAPCRRLQFNLSDLFAVPRLGIGALAAYLKAHGYHDVQTVDIIAEKWWVTELLDHFASKGVPDVVGVGTTILSVREAFELCKAIKEQYPEVTTVLGGPGIGFEARALLQYGTHVDYFVRGEGEGPLLALVQALEKGDSTEDVPGLIGRGKDGPFENSPVAVRDLNDGITCDYQGQPMEKYRLHPPMGIYPPATMIETTRRCSFPCEFCCLSGVVSYQSPENVVKKILELQRDFGIREVHFVDPTFTLNRKRTEALLRGLKKLNIRWSCKTRVDLMPGDLVRAMADAGCYLVAFGVESGEDSILQSLSKKAVSEQALETFRLCRKYKIRTTAYLMVGNPGETDETVETNMRFVRQLKPDYVLYDILQADPGNPLTHEMIAKGVFSLDDLEKYYLTDEPCRLHEITIAGHSQETVKKWITKASSDFYLRPRYFYEKIRDLRTIQDAVNLTSGGTAFLKDLFGIGRLWRWDK